MGWIKKFNLSNKKREEEKRKDFENRIKQFVDEYKLLSRKYGVDIQASLDFIEGGRGGIIPRGEFIDISERIKAELKAEEEKGKIKQ